MFASGRSWTGVLVEEGLTSGMGLTGGDVQEILNRITYKPGWSLELVHGGGFDQVDLRVMVDAIDSRDRSTKIQIAFQHSIPYPLPDEAAFLAWVRCLLQNVESHELDEWFRIGGRCVNDPHARPSFLGGDLRG